MRSFAATMIGVFLLPIFAFTAQPLTWRFSKPGDMLGWRAEGYKRAKVAGGAFRGMTERIPLLYSPKLDLDSAQYPYFYFRAKSGKDGTGSVYFKHAGEELSEERKVTFSVSGNSFKRYIVRMADSPKWASRIESVRFDILYHVDTNVEITEMGFLAQPPGDDDSSLNLILNGDFERRRLDGTGRPEDWQVVSLKNSRISVDDALTLTAKSPGARAMVRQPIMFDNLGTYEIALDSKGRLGEGDRLALNVNIDDIFGKPITAMRYAVALDSAHFARTFDLPKQAAFGTVEIALISAGGKGSATVDDVSLRLVKPLEVAKAVEKTHRLGSTLAITPVSGTVKIPVVRARNINGTPSFVIDGRVHTTMNHWVDNVTAPGLIANSRDNGIHIYGINVSDIPWTPPNKYDLSKVDEICSSTLQQDPDAYFILILSLDDINSFGKALKGWTDVYPSERALNSDRSPDIQEYSGKISNSPSLASKRWQETAEDLFRQLIRRVRRSRYGERVIGYQPASGVTYEWQQWGSVAWPPIFVDYSEPARLAFVEWLKEKYSDITALNTAWKVDYPSFDRIAIPTKEERSHSDVGIFLDPEKSRLEIDYRTYYSEQVAGVILRLARAIKEETDGKSLCGVYYGYVTHVLGPYRYQLVGHSALRKVLESPDIDFLISPSDYGDREVGGGSGFMSVTDSVKLHGKAWIDQADLRTFHTNQNIGRLGNLADSKAGWIRHYGNALVSGVCEQVYDFSQGWTTGDPRLMRLLGKLRDIESRLMNVSRDSNAANDSIAVIVDEKSTYYTAMASNIHLDTVVGQYSQLCRTGVGFDTYLLDDLPNVPPYKCYLFLNTFRITREQQEFIGRHLKKDGKTLIFVYAPGIIDEQKLLPERVSEITGIQVADCDQEIPLAVQLVKGKNPVLKYCRDIETYGYGNKYSPTLIPWEGELLGLLGNLAGIVIKRNPNWTCVFSAAPGLPAQLLRGIAEDAGVRVTNPTDGDITFAGDRLIVVHTATGGRRTFRCVAGARTVEELVTERTYTMKEGAFAVDLPPRSTSIFLAK